VSRKRDIAGIYEKGRTREGEYLTDRQTSFASILFSKQETRKQIIISTYNRFLRFSWCRQKV